MPSDSYDLPQWVIDRRLLIGKKIRDARLRGNLTQMRLAEMVGVEHRTIHRIEYGTSDPSLSVLLLIADAVRVPLPDLISADPHPIREQGKGPQP
ncbi:helix-turn-helix domain-containing protein [Streptomycetaceae bacterium NBC_01309]